MESGATVHYAICIMKEDNGSGVNGIVKFVQEEGKEVRITSEISGLTPGNHGFHIHEFGKGNLSYFDLGNLTKGCATAGAHYNPAGKTHGGPADEIRHVGDLGNITAGDDKVGRYDATDRLIRIYGQENNIIGRSVVVHEKVDDLGKGGNEESLKTGNAGPRLACGVIAVSGPF